MTINERLQLLRREMRAESIDIIIFPTNDPHNSEYLAPHWEARKWITGFTGSAGTAVVTLNEAALWTDSRYFIQASEQLRGSEYQLMKEGLTDTPTPLEWIERKLSTYGGTTVAINGMLMSYAELTDMRQRLQQLGGITLRTNYDPMRMLWRDRPAVPAGEIRIQAPEYAGESVVSKLERIREALRSVRCTAHFTTELMNIAWTTNLRGCDVNYTPVFVAFLYIDLQSAVLFCSADSMTAEARLQMADAGVEVMAYDSIAAFLKTQTKDERILCDASVTCHTLYDIIRQRAHNAPSPIPLMKAVKNDAELQGFREAMTRDGVAMVRWLRWLLPAVEKGGQTEISVSEKLENMRAEHPLFEQLSFGTICAYNAHGALPHYSATPESNSPLHPEGLLLVDSGAQYADGTTDITRTIPLGPVSQEMRLAYTLVLKANITIATTPFPEGTTGTQLDAIARTPIWKNHRNYLHGTGHGVGAHLAVHEGPHRMALQWKPTPLQAGMTLTDEPGLYYENEFGIRTENTMIVTDAGTNAFGHFLALTPLTLCPINTEPIIWDMLSDEEVEWLNHYHAQVEQLLMPHLTDEADRQWLTNACQSVCKKS